jgi:hypothetical protein
VFQLLELALRAMVLGLDSKTQHGLSVFVALRASFVIFVLKCRAAIAPP